ncbi:MAG: biosynthetic-type acetolactate synthase large subunit [Clostridia bacterium]|nr:biosynthetic-type acetolactate synthase large subunit [Clostridia bacterium]
MRMTGAGILIETLCEMGVSHVFGYPGGQVVNIYDELWRARRRITRILTAHEQGAAHAADGYARATGKPGVVIATSGPGATNLVTGIATAMLDSVPMVAITGNVPTGLIGRDSFQEINIYGITLPITKHNYFVTDVKDLADTIRDAFKIATSGRPGPVLIDIPKDVQTAKCEYRPADHPSAAGEIPGVNEEETARQLELARKLISESERPYIFVGGGAAGAGIADEVIKFSEKIDAYIGCTLMGLSAIPTDNRRYLGMEGMHGHYSSSMANKNADLIICLGARFSDRTTGNAEKYSRKAKVIQLDADIAEIDKNIPAAIGIVGDLRETFPALAEGIGTACHPEWSREIEEYRKEEKRIAEAADKKRRSSGTGVLSPKDIFEVINSLKSADTPVVTDVGQHQMWAAQYTEFELPRKFISSGGLGTMGFGMGAAIGTWFGCGCRPVLVTGDGSFGMNLNELATAVTYRIPLVIVLFNNGVLGMVRQWQTLFFGKRYSSTVLERKTDYVKLAEAFGAKGIRVKDTGEFAEALKAALKSSLPTVIEVPVGKDELVLPMLPPGGSTDDIITSIGEEDMK